MKVIAKYQLAYKGKMYVAGDTIKMDKKDLERYENDVTVKVSFRSPYTKPIRKTKLKTKTTSK